MQPIVVALDAVHRKIGDDQIVLPGLQRLQQFRAGCSAGRDAHAGDVCDRGDHGVADDRMVVGDGDPHFAFRLIHQKGLALSRLREIARA
mgnify:CR=1 FL=1